MRLRAIFLFPLATATIYSCESASEPPAGYEDVLLEGTVTDETLVAFTEALAQRTPADVSSQMAVFDAPMNGAALPRNPPPAFSWGIGSNAQREKPMPTNRWADLNLPIPGISAAPTPFASPLRELFGGPRQAFAHGDPYNGTGTFLVFSTDANPKLLRVFTSNLAFTPSQAAWDDMAGAGKPITATLVSAIFEQNRIGADDGPFAGASITFTISP